MMLRVIDIIVPNSLSYYRLFRITNQNKFIVSSSVANSFTLC